MTAEPAVAELRRFLRARPGEDAVAPAERCELCAAEVAVEHPHLVHVVERSLRCACRPCALLFVDRPTELGGFAGYRTIPERILRDPGFVLPEDQWDDLQIPVGMAFFFLSTASRGSGASQESGGFEGTTVIACYPSPAGATESELDLAHWSDGIGAGRLAGTLEPDVEALLVRRRSDGAGTGATGTECLLVPIDVCYRLVGVVRRHWRGFDGGAQAWVHIDAFFDDVRARARDLAPVPSGAVAP